MSNESEIAELKRRIAQLENDRNADTATLKRLKDALNDDGRGPSSIYNWDNDPGKPRFGMGD